MGDIFNSGAAQGFGVGGVAGGLVGGIMQNRHDKKTSQLRDRLLDNSGRPSNPTFRTILNSNNQLQAPFRLGVNGDEARLRNNFTNFQNGTPIAARENTQNALLDRRERDRIAAQGQSQLNNSLSSLAFRGGLRSGAGERLARQQINTNNRALQNQAFENQRRSLGIATNDANRQFGLLQNLASRADSRDRFNIGNSINDIGRQNANDRANFSQALKEFGANKQTLLELENRPKGGIGGIASGIFGK